MTHVIRDGFDFYATVADGGQNYWPTLNSSVVLLSSTTRFGVGQALQVSASASAASITNTVSYATNEPNNFAVFALYPAFSLIGTSSLGWGIRWFDGTTVQCSVWFDAEGNVAFYRGDHTGTLLATYTAAFSGSAWTQWQIEVIINSTTGAIHIRKNGNTSDDFAATGLNTQTTSDAYANGVDLYSITGSGRPWNIDDLWLFNGNTGGTPNTFIGDVRAVQVMPNADSSVAFTRNPTTFTQTLGSQAGTRTIPANSIQTIQEFTPIYPTVLTNVILNFNAAVTGHANVALYDNSGALGAPGVLLGTATAVTNPVAGNNTFTFGSPPLLSTTATYWIAILTDASSVLKSATGVAPTSYTDSQTYSSGFANPFVAVTTTNVTVSAVITLTPAGNFAMVQEAIEDQSTTTVQDSNVGDTDLYKNGGLPVTPSSILGLSLRVFGAKSDAGARSGQPTMTSGSTVQAGTSVALSTTFENLVQVQDVDPATGVAWTASGVNNLKFGMKVSA